MNSLFRRLLLGAVVLGMAVSTVSAYDFNKKRAVAEIKGFGKYPYEHVYNPFSNEVDLILYGCLDNSDNVKLVKTAQDFEALVPVQFTMSFPDNFIKIKKQYSGFNETYTTRIADSTLRLFEFLPSEDYKKDFKDEFLMKEIKGDYAIKIVVPSLEHLDAIINYLKTKFEVTELAQELEQNTTDITTDNTEAVIEVTEETTATEAAAEEDTTTETILEGIKGEPAVEVAATPRPLLVIEIESGEKLTQDQLNFLNDHFELGNPNDADVKAQFATAEECIEDAMVNMKDFYQVGQSFGEMIMETIEKDFDKGDVKKLTVKAMKFFALAFTFALTIKLSNDFIINPATKWIENKIQPATPTRPAQVEVVNVVKVVDAEE